MLWEVYRYFDRGWIHRYWVTPISNFKYEGFTWIEPISAEGMVLLFLLMGVLSLFIAAGFLSRWSTAGLLLVFTYTFLLEQARYLNHFYLVILILCILTIVPANHTRSVDAWLWPKIRRARIPIWPLFLLRFQVGIVYFFGGVAKLNTDWLSGSPLQIWLPRISDLPIFGSYLELPETAVVASYVVLFLDLLALPLLLFRRTRPWAVLLLVIFHLINDTLFSIGIFPWLMIAALFLYLPSSWPRQFIRYLRSGSLYRTGFLLMLSLSAGILACWFHGEYCLIPFLCGFLSGSVLFWDFHKRPDELPHGINSLQDTAFITEQRLFFREPEITLESENDQKPAAGWSISTGGVITVLLVVSWCLIQITLPLRHFVIPGNPSWTEEGHRFSWHMKLRTKSCDSEFYTLNPAFGSREKIETEGYLEDWQKRKVDGRPQLIVQFAQNLSAIHDHQPVYADVLCSLNSGEEQRLIDPDADLSRVRFRDWRRNDWILLQDH